MLYVLKGKDTLRQKRIVKEILDELRNKYSFLERLDVDLEEDKEGYIKVVEFFSQGSIFGGAKVGVVYNAFIASPKEWINFLESNDFNKDTAILVGDYKEDFSFLSKKRAVKEINLPELEGEELKKFLQKEAETFGITFSPDAFSFLVDYFSSLPEGRSWYIYTELRKMSFLGKQKINKKDLETISSFFQLEKVWLLTKRILDSKKLEEKLVSLEKLLLGGIDYTYIFNSLAFNASLNKAQKLAELDLAIKSGKLETKEALLLFILESEV